MLLYVIQFFSSKFFKFSKIFQKIFKKLKNAEIPRLTPRISALFSILGVTPFSFSIAHSLYYVNMLRRVFRNN